MIRIKDELLREQREELDAYRELVEELQAKLGINDQYSQEMEIKCLPILKVF